ncbi:MAG: hypothetical protein HDKAJFGB_03256 [Anaerolineae bacterium]|nr:hypothetical protein [Anaerolineae bacterium]
MSRALILTGMHRSGTSLIASLLAQAGVALGKSLLAPKANDNPRGFFEDADFVNFHQELLYARGLDILVARDFVLQPDATETERARALIAARADQALWGWKDPRTSLVLEFWRALLPDARFLLVYRHPLDVTLSLARRLQLVGFDFYAALEAWYAYNRALSDFARAHPTRTLVCSSYAIVEQIDAFRAALAEKLDLHLTLDAAQRDAIFSRELWRQPAHTSVTENVLRQIHPDAMALYDALQTRAALRDTTSLQNPSAEQNALAQFIQQLPTPLAAGQQRALAHLLAAVMDTDLYERFSVAHARQTIELDAERRAWENTALARERALRAQTEWAAPRLQELERLERNRVVRALKRVGLL